MKPTETLRMLELMNQHRLPNRWRLFFDLEPNHIVVIINWVRNFYTDIIGMLVTCFLSLNMQEMLRSLLISPGPTWKSLDYCLIYTGCI